MGNREEWLIKAKELLISEVFDQHPNVPDVPEVHLSVGWPGSNSKKTTGGECWSRAASADGLNHIFISPAHLSSPARIVATLAHEIIHAIDDCESGHRGEFARIARTIGLKAPMTESIPDNELSETIAGIVDTLGPFPSGSVAVPRATKARPSYVACRCDETGFTARLTFATFRDYGAPLCPCCQTYMDPDN